MIVIGEPDIEIVTEETAAPTEAPQTVADGNVLPDDGLNWSPLVPVN